MSAACLPTLGQVCEIRQCDGPTGLAEDPKELVARPKHKGRPPIGPFEGSRFVAGRLMEVLFVRVHIAEGIGRRKFLVFYRQLDQQRRAAVEPPQFGEADTAVVDLARFQFRLRPAAAAGPVAGVFGDPALLDGEERQMKIAVGPVRRGDEHGRHRGIRPLQCRESELGRGIGMLRG